MYTQGKRRKTPHKRWLITKAPEEESPLDEETQTHSTHVTLVKRRRRMYPPWRERMTKTTREDLSLMEPYWPFFFFV